MHDPTPINGKPDSERGFRGARDRVLLGFEEHVIWRGGDFLHAASELLRRPFEWVHWTLQRGVIWPLQDRFGLLGPAGQTLAAGSAVAVVTLLAVGGLALAGSGGSGTESTRVAATIPPRPPLELSVTPADSSGVETLEGAAPVFKPKHNDPSGVDSAKAIESTPATGSTSAATGTISSDPDRSPSEAATASTSGAVVDGPPAGPKAIAVARDFADAFVVFETGGDKATVRESFAATATPELSRSLLRRPPRLPANLEVPQAKVMNVVAGPSHGGLYTMSVSLLRVGVTSELRLDMENLKDGGWRVTNVLG